MSLSTTILTSRDKLKAALSFDGTFGINNEVDLHYAKSGAGTPSGTSTSPDYIGQKYYDTTNKVWYMAVDYTPAAGDFQAIGGTNVQGPASSTDNAVARFDATTGELIQNSVLIVDDAGATSGITSLAIGGALSGVTTLAMGGALSGVTTIAASGSVTFSTATAGPILKQGANGRCGTFVANGATPVTVSNSSVAITDAIIISLNTVGGTVGVQPHVATITGASGFTVVCTASDTSTYNYTLIKNAA